MAEKVARRDIQGMRALAVTLVLLNHFWPSRLTGGYIGVDVFFVISGFLITSGLLRRPPQTARDLASFWARRVRRLLPAACLVLVVTLVASFVWAPRTMLQTIANQTIAAAGYVQNWVLAASATDYFAATSPHTPIQHFWSLSVEEQFYLVWPVLIMVCALLIRKAKRSIPWMAIVLGTVTVVSIGFSVWYTVQVPAAAYFVTPTRMWELGVGGLTALLVQAHPASSHIAARSLTAWAGAAAVAASALFFTSATPFPGWAAVLPVLGAAALIWAEADKTAWSPQIIYRWKPVQVVGDISYSIYLWHWPVLIIVPFALGHDIHAITKIGLAVVVIILSWLTKTLVEDRVRFAKFFTTSLRRTFIMGLSVMALVMASSLGFKWYDNHEQAVELQRVPEAIAKAGQCLGAGSLLNPACADTPVTGLVYPPSMVTPHPWENCLTNPPYTVPVRCHFGVDNGTKKILVIGNSHATQWTPAIDAVAKAHDWSVDTLTANSCFPNIGIQENKGADTAGCAAIGDDMLSEATSGQYDLVVLAAWKYVPIVGASDNWAAIAQSQNLVYQKLKASGVPVLVIRTAPYAVFDVPDCIADHPYDWTTACQYPDTSDTTTQDAMYDLAAADTSGQFTTVSIDNLLCAGGTCQPVVGGVIVFLDSNHLSVQFVETCQPVIEQPMVAILGP